MAQLPIKDPAQLKKIMGEIEKADKKLIDEAIKSISESNAGATTGGSGYGPLPPPANSAPQENQSTDVDMQKLANILRKIRF
jgi:hypothetical protein